jgi:AbrB family looped-hinge helix DNA binding protein
MPISRVLTKGQIVIPKELRKKANISPGDKVEVKMTKEGITILPIKKTHTEKFRGIIKGKLSLEELENLYAEKS